MKAADKLAPINREVAEGAILETPMLYWTNNGLGMWSLHDRKHVGQVVGSIQEKALENGDHVAGVSTTTTAPEEDQFYRVFSDLGKAKKWTESKYQELRPWG